MHVQAVIFTMRYVYVHMNNTLLPLVIISPLYNHKQDVGNIGVSDFTRFGGIFKLEKFQYTHPDFETKIGRKKCVLYTGIYARHYMVNISNVKAVKVQLVSAFILFTCNCSE